MNNKSIDKFHNITMTGRLCYIFMCIEKYLLELYPNRDWSPVSRRMWQWTTHYWDESWEIYSEAVPEFILEYSTYEETNSLSYDGKLNRNDYYELTSLFNGITDGKGQDEICRVLMIPCDFGNECDGTCFHAAEPYVAKLIEEIESILNKHNISLPDKSLLNKFAYTNIDSENQNVPEAGWGDFESTEFLSIILK